jgi:hypothetical protein
MSPLFSKREPATLEQFVSAAVQTAFEYPAAENLQKVDTSQVLSARETTHLIKEVPAFIIAVNQMLVMIAADQGKVKRFKGDSQHDIGQGIGYGFAVTTGMYLESTGLSHDKAANEAERIGDKSLKYLQTASGNVADDAPVQDIFFEYCKLFALGFSQDKDKNFVVFDFAKQLYRNIESAFNGLKVS